MWLLRQTLLPKTMKKRNPKSKKALKAPAAKLKPAPIVRQEKSKSELMIVLEKVVPFFFHTHKKPAVTQPAALKPVAKAVVKKQAVIRAKKKTKTPVKKKPARTQRKAVATIEVRKRVKTPVKKVPVAASALDELEQDTPVTAAATADVPVTPAPAKKPKGFFVLKKEEEKTDAKEGAEALLADAQDDAFLNKVALAQPLTASTETKVKGWSLFKDRFFGRTPSTAKDSKPADIPVDPNKDSFLQRVQKKDVNAVVGTSVDVEKIHAQKVVDGEESASALEEVASASSDPEPITMSDASATKAPVKGRILSAADLRKETREAKEAALRVEKEVKEIKEEMKATQKEREKELEKIDEARAEKKPEAPVEVTVNFKKKAAKKKGGFQTFLAGLGHIGLGKERMRFVQNLAMMLNAGLPLIDSLKTLQMETRAKPMRKLLQKILDSVENGSPLWRAMEEQSFFSLHALALVRIGEEAGNLSENMQYLADQEEKDHALKSKVKMAMIYPSIVMTIMFIIVIGLGMFVLPNLIGVLYSLNVPLPFVTRMVIAFTNAFTTYGAVAVPGSMVGFLVLIILAKYTALKGVFQWMMFRIPGIGRLASEATIARFGVILGGLLKAGVPVIEAMQSLVEVTPIVAYRKLYSRMQDHVSIGDSFSKSFAAIKGSEKLLPPSVQQLVITGEKSGSLADIMLKIADIYDKKATETAEKLPVILEPMLLLFIGGLVGTIAFAIIVPIYSIVGNVGR